MRQRAWNTAESWGCACAWCAVLVANATLGDGLALCACCDEERRVAENEADEARDAALERARLRAVARRQT